MIPSEKASAKPIWGIIRLVLSIFLFLYSLLTLIPLWWNEGILYNLTALEDSGGICGMSLVLFLIPKHNLIPAYRFTRWLPLLAFLLLLQPAIRASREFHKLDESVTPGALKAFSWGRWIKGNKPPVASKRVEIQASDNKKLEGFVFHKNGLVGKRPLILILHGGGFTTGSAIHGAELAICLADHEWITASVDYRLAPETAYPGQIEDVKNWISYLRNHADELDIDTTKIFLAGESAGATIALNSAYTLHDPKIGAVANLYGITSADKSQAELWESITEPLDMLDAYRGSTSLDEINPVAQCSLGGIPTISIHGQKDPIVHWQHAQILSDALAKAHIDQQLVLLPWATHLFNHPGFGPSGQLSVEYIDRFFRRHL